jgi:hypothetical protein
VNAKKLIRLGFSAFLYDFVSTNLGTAMRSPMLRTNVVPTVILVVILFATTMSSAQTSDELILRDDFDSELLLDWEVVRPDPSHASLEMHPGKLTITTQYGSLQRSQDTAKNLYFIAPPEGMSDFVVTTCIEDFLPETHWQQAGLMFWDDDGDNFIKWVRDAHSMNYPLLNAYWESDHDAPHARIYSVEIPKEKFWLRVIKRGELYQCLASVDGENFVTYAIIPYNDGTPTKSLSG